MYRYLEMKCEESKMMKVLLLLLIALFIGNGVLFAQKNEKNSIEKIGKHLSELLINRGDIAESPFALKIECLYPDKEFAKFEDSPAEFILAMLYSSQH